jgi:predicted alpha/beta superfamily hydrolase
MRLLALIVAIGIGSSAPAAAPTPIQIGVAHQVNSKPLGEMRVVNVALPASYAKAPTRRYPVIYLIDGGVEQDLLHVTGTVHLGALWGRSQEAIVVGVETKDRRRELVGPTRDPALLKKYPTAGKSAAFRAYLRDEVKPLVAANYRTSGSDVVVGESLAGLFIVETYLAEPSLFGGYAAISPSLWWDDEALSKSFASRIGRPQSGHPLYLTIGDEGTTMQAGVDRVVTGLRGAAKGWCYAPRPDLTHATIYHTVLPSALGFLLPPAEAPAPEFGFEVKCSAKG